MSNHNDMTSTEMTEYAYLIHLLRCGIHDMTPMEVTGNVSFEKVFQYAMDHDVANLAFYAVDRLEKKPETDLYHRWKLRRDLALVRDMNQDFACQELVQAFDSQGILYKELQGTVLKKLYPRPEYRTMSDIDFIVEKSSLERCGMIFRQLGYKCKHQDDFEIDGCRRPDIFVELHTDYFSPYTRYHSIMNTPNFHRELTEVERYTELYLYNVLHIAKHYFSSGCGIRRVLDMYYIDQCYGDKIDSEYVSLMLKEIGLTEFSVELIRLARAWFGKPDESTTVSAMGREIVEAGLHGKREKYINRRVQSMSAKESVSFGSKIKYLLSRIFPAFKIMEIKYPVLKKVKILYPLCAIHRIFRMLLGKNRKASVLDLRLVLHAEKKDDI